MYGHDIMKKYNYETFKARVEGEIDGIPYVQNFKRLKNAKNFTMKSGGILTDLITFESIKWKDDKWLKV